MFIEIKPETEALVREEMFKGSVESIDEVIVLGADRRVGVSV